DYITQATEPELSSKPNPDKWSKKEILGHLIDSGINNLQRFTEIQFAKLPYKIRKYNQDALVKANNYQEANLKEITAFWLAVNNRIMFVMQNQTETSLSYQIELSENEYADLRFLMEDYVDHLEHHLNQIIKNSDHEL
ncbi:MAG: DinB family protein, partial [Saprospiraceae bacterium]|nr:DinB family protein [Saprospiraceae bacterium]